MTLTGTGYDQKPASSLMELVQVGRGTPYGEVLRRYWHPVALATDATTAPKRISILGEEFIPEVGLIPEVVFFYTDTDTDTGVGARSVRHSATGHDHYRATEVVFPNIRMVSSPLVTDEGACRYVGWVVPRDDTHFAIFHLVRTTPGVEPFGRSRFQMGGDTWVAPGTEGAEPAPPRTSGKAWHELTPEEHQRTPGDYEAQGSQGAIPAHSRESLSTTDQGITMIRRPMAKQIKAVAAGRDPIGVSRTGTDAVHAIRAGTWTDRAPWLVDSPIGV